MIMASQSWGTSPNSEVSPISDRSDARIDPRGPGPLFYDDFSRHMRMQAAEIVVCAGIGECE
jgi:hypothetical protein